MQTREFMAVSQPNVALAELAATPHGWTAQPAAREDVATIGEYRRAIELRHARSPVAVVVVEDRAVNRGRTCSDSSGGSFVYLSSGFSDNSRLSMLLQHSLIQELLAAMGSVTLRTRLQPARVA